MNDPQANPEIADNSAAASDASVSPKAIPNGAAASDSTSAPSVPINPDELHDLFAVAPNSAEGSDEEDPMAQLRNDPNYSALIRDLEYIAAQARLLFAPAEESPSDELWGKIKKEMDTNSKPG